MAWQTDRRRQSRATPRRRLAAGGDRSSLSVGGRHGRELAGPESRYAFLETTRSPVTERRPGFFNGGCGTVRREVTPVANTDEKHRAAATCPRCGEIGIVQVWPDGTLQPLGQSDFCECPSSTLRVLETDADELP